MPGNYDRKDHLYQRAKDEGYRSRAAYKLKELQKKFKIVRSGSRVLDLGAWPGGWVQAALELIDDRGKVVGIDLQRMEPFDDDRVLLIEGDVRDEENLVAAQEFVGGRFHAVLSDMSAKLTGVREVDSAASAGIAELALYVADRLLETGGCLVIKVFKSGSIDEFVRASRPRFETLKRVELDSSRGTSNEFYIVGLGFRGLGFRRNGA